MGQLGPYLAVVEFFVGFRECPGGLRWEVVVLEQIELQAKLLNYFLGSNKSNINQVRTWSSAEFPAHKC